MTPHSLNHSHEGKERPAEGPAGCPAEKKKAIEGSWQRGSPRCDQDEPQLG